MPIVDNQIHYTLKRINEKRSTIHIEKARQWNTEDWVLVDRRHLQVIADNNKSFTGKCAGPHQVIKVIVSQPHVLEVPEGTRWYNVLYSTLLKAFGRWDDPQDMDEDEAEVRRV